MKRSPGGYTFIEALMVVAISATIFIGVTTMFSGSREKVDFNQAKADIDTKLKGYVNQVSTGTFAGNTTHGCSRHTGLGSEAYGRPKVIPAAGITSGSNETCIYLGKALQIIEDSDKIYVYEVLGIRNKYSADVDTGMSVTTYNEAMPSPAGDPTGSGDFKWYFVEEYTLPAGLITAHAKVNGNTANVLMIYGNLSNNTSSRGVNVFSHDYQYNNDCGHSNYTGPVNAVYTDSCGSTRMYNCIRQVNNHCLTTYSLESNGWDLCVQNSNNTKRARISVKPTSTGLVTKVSDGTC